MNYIDGKIIKNFPISIYVTVFNVDFDRKYFSKTYSVWIIRKNNKSKKYKTTKENL